MWNVTFLKDIDVSQKRVLIRADLNVPISEDGKIRDDHRIKQTLPTIKHVIERGGRAIVMSHLGRPTGRLDTKCSLKPVAERLATLLGTPVTFASDCVGVEVESLLEQLPPGSTLLLENLRFQPGETANDAAFAAELAKFGDVFVNDGFATMHRSHASIVGVPKHFKQRAVGLLVEKELAYYEKALINPKHPFCVVIGGSKQSTKLNALFHLVSKVDKVIIGGALGNTFLAAQGIQMGRSIYQPELFPRALELLVHLARKDCKLYLPVDFMVGPSPTASGLARAVPSLEVPADMMALDIGPATSLLFKEALTTAETIVWNGPMGVFENEEYSKGTTDMIEHLSSAHGMKVVGGGETDSAIHKMELGHKFDFISTGGGAFLTMLDGNPLAAFEALKH